MGQDFFFFALNINMLQNFNIFMKNLLLGQFFSNVLDSFPKCKEILGSLLPFTGSLLLSPRWSWTPTTQPWRGMCFEPLRGP